MDEASSETIFTGYAGGSCTIKGMHGYVTAFHKEGPHVVAAFVHVPPDYRDADGESVSKVNGVLAAPGRMLLVRLGRSLDEKHREVVSVRVIERDEFDRLTTLDTLRRDLGWR